MPLSFSKRHYNVPRSTKSSFNVLRLGIAFTKHNFKERHTKLSNSKTVDNGVDKRIEYQDKICNGKSNEFCIYVACDSLVSLVSAHGVGSKIDHQNSNNNHRQIT